MTLGPHTILEVSNNLILLNMRTLDPEIWSKDLRKPPLNLSRRMRFGRRPQTNAESRIMDSLRATMREYWVNCSVTRPEYLTDRNSPIITRYVYSMLLLVLLCLGVVTILFSSYESRIGEPSTVNQLEVHTVQHVPFPAVALCSSNVISKRALRDYIMTLISTARHQNSTYSAEAIEEYLTQLGHLQSMTMPPHSVDMTQFMNFWSAVHPRARVSSLMRRFATPCSAMLVRCSWRGETQPCLQLFQTRVTPLGFCCVFNSRYQSEDVFRVPKFLDVTGAEYGLSVVLKQDTNDFGFVRRPSYDYDVLVFDGSDYPLLEGGGARMYPVERNASVYITLTTSLHQPEEGLGQSSSSKMCRSRRFSGARFLWSRAWCLTECRADTVAAFCDCELHTLPRGFTGHQRHIEQCSLTDLPCLNKHREKFIYYYPGNQETLEEELQNAQDCTHCVPDCSRSVYTAGVSVARYNRNKLLKDQLLVDLPVDNVTTVRLFYPSRHLKTFVLENNFRWYEVFVQCGSGWAAVAGASLISVSELVFHAVFRWRHHYLRRRRPAGTPSCAMSRDTHTHTHTHTQPNGGH